MNALLTSPTAQTASAASRSKRFHIPSLDGFRALSFVLVFVAHAGLGDIVPGGFAVTVFFFLSGYLITTLMRREFDASGTIGFKQFYLRRVIRILPAFYLVLALAVLAAKLGALPGGFEPRAVAAQAMHMANYWIVKHSYDGMPRGTGVGWSLAVEEHFYLVFPVLYFVLRRVTRSAGVQAVALGSLCAVALLWRCILVYAMHVGAHRTYVATDTHFDSILFGCILAVYGNPMLDGASRIGARTWKYALMPAGVGLLLLTLVYRDGAFRETFRYTLQGIALFPIFIAALRFPAWGPFRLLNTRIASWLGVLSYSLYLVHHIVLHAIEAHVHTSALGQGTLAFVLSVAAAWLIYRLVEQPCARLRKYLPELAARKPAQLPVDAGFARPSVVF